MGWAVSRHVGRQGCPVPHGRGRGQARGHPEQTQVLYLPRCRPVRSALQEPHLNGRPLASWPSLLTTQQEKIYGRVFFCEFCEKKNTQTALKLQISCRWASGLRTFHAILVNHSFSLVVNFLPFHLIKPFRLNKPFSNRMQPCCLALNPTSMVKPRVRTHRRYKSV